MCLLGPSALENLVLVGDFNVKMMVPSVKGSDKIYALIDSFSLTQYVKETTRVTGASSSLIDLVFASGPSITSCCVDLHIGNSDHCTVRFCVNTGVKMKRGRKSKSHLVWHYARADFIAANALLSNTYSWCDLSSLDIESAWAFWKTEFLQVMSLCIPSARIRKYQVLWINNFIQVEMKKRDSIFCKARRTGREDVWRSQRNKVVHLLKRAKQEYLSNIDSAKGFWSAINATKGSRTSIPSLKLDEDVASTDAD